VGRGGALLPRIHSHQPLGLIRKSKKEKKKVGGHLFIPGKSPSSGIR
jgi:hypothetical protein